MLHSVMNWFYFLLLPDSKASKIEVKNLTRAIWTIKSLLKHAKLVKLVYDLVELFIVTKLSRFCGLRLEIV